MPATNARSNSAAATGWNTALEALPEACVLQAYQWGQLKSDFGWSVARHASPAGMAQVLFRRTPVGTLAYIPRGPLPADGESHRDPASLLEEIHALCRSRRAFALKIEPPWPDSPKRSAALADLGFRPASQSVQPRSTVLVDLHADDDGILGRMKPKTRYNIRLAARKGVTVREGTAADLPAFGDLMRITGARDGFAVHSADYYRVAFDLFAPSGMAALLLAEADSEVLAAIMVMAFGETAYYLFGASSDRRRNLMPTYAVQWAGIKWAKGRGCRHYDLWGIPDEVGRNPAPHLEGEVERADGLWGVWRFKRGFGGEVRRYTGAWDYPYRPLAYAAYRVLYRLRSRLGAS